MSMLNHFFDYKPEVLALDEKAMELCQPYFHHMEEIRDYNQLKMLKAFADTQMSSTDMLGTTGYGLWDTGRAKLEQIFAEVMGAEDALVRSQFQSGTHTLAVALFGLLRAGDTLLAATGRTVFMHSFGCFASRRAFDQAFMSAAYAKLPVHVIGSDPGVCAAYNGGTHMPFEDCALYMSVPEAVVIDPVDYAQINCLTKKLAASGKFSYMRMIRKGFTTVYGDGSDFEIGKGVTLKEGKDVAIIASGIMVDEALKAQEQLAAEGISAKVIDMFTWKPLDEQLILDSAAECGAIVTAENHQVKVGLGSAVANVVIKNNPVPMEMVGVEDRFGQVGAESFLREEYGLTAAHIVEAAKKAIARKNG